jgi:hypothetical protein
MKGTVTIISVFLIATIMTSLYFLEELKSPASNDGDSNLDFTTELSIN